MDSGISPLRQSQRLLAAIVLTDAVSFSARMSENEEKALIAINQDLKYIAEICELFEGQVLKSTGDGLLMCFFSAVHAVSCALEIQNSFTHFSDQSDHFAHRIGIHLGDVYLNESDVMGNGVNIAARLEAASNPGEVCVSQVVYDVVKSRLNLNATFLGPLHLKNIQEEVPAYQIHSVIDSEPVVLVQDHEGEKEVTRPLTHDQPELQQNLSKVAQVLAQHSNNLRIKKLIFGTTQNLWENDPTVLNQFSLEGLVGSLLQRHPTQDQCKASLYKVVATLNRKTEYAQVADIVLTALKPLFSQQASLDPPTTQVATEPAQPLNHEPVQLLQKQRPYYHKIADCLEGNPQKIRIKKVLYCFCYQEWENNCDRIAHIDTSTLVEKLHQIAPSVQDLKYRLRYLLQRLNRKAKYSPVMDAIFQACQILYQQEDKRSSVALLDMDTSDSSSLPTCFNTETPLARPESTVVHVPQPLESSLLSATVTGLRDRSDLFELRLDIIKYCNPLRAKILLFSVLNGPFSGSSRELSALKSQTLEDLLRQIFDYCPTLEDLDSKLTILSHCIDDPEASHQVISAITNAIQSYYPSSKPKAAKPRSTVAQPPAQTPRPVKQLSLKVTAQPRSIPPMRPVSVYG
jgi:adenylate cyclase